MESQLKINSVVTSLKILKWPSRCTRNCEIKNAVINRTELEFWLSQCLCFFPVMFLGKTWTHFSMWYISLLNVLTKFLSLTCHNQWVRDPFLLPYNSKLLVSCYLERTLTLLWRSSLSCQQNKQPTNQHHQVVSSHLVFFENWSLHTYWIKENEMYCFSHILPSWLQARWLKESTNKIYTSKRISDCCQVW